MHRNMHRTIKKITNSFLIVTEHLNYILSAGTITIGWLKKTFLMGTIVIGLAKRTFLMGTITIGWAKKTFLMDTIVTGQLK